MFPGLFQQSFQLPLGLIQEEIQLDINFSRNGELGNNNRAIFCPSLSTQTPSSVTSAAIMVQGQGYGGAQTDLVLANPTSHLGAASKGSGFKIMVDLDGNGFTTNLRIIDAGAGYVGSEQLTFTHADLDTTDLTVVPAYKFNTWNSATNFWVDPDNLGHQLRCGWYYTNPVNPDLNFKIIATAVDGGNNDALTTCQLASVEDGNNMCFNTQYDKPYDVVGGAKIYVIKNILTITHSAGAGAFVVGDYVEEDGNSDNQAIVDAIDGNDRPTTLYVIN